MKLLVAGGAGFIGSNYLKLVLNGTLKGVARITVLDKLTYAGTLSNLATLPQTSFDFVQGDICDQTLVENLVSQHDALINFAAESHVDRSIENPGDFVNTNVLGTLTLLEAARRKKAFRFIQISTDEVYGSVRFPSKEEDPLLPSSPYSASKAAADLLVMSYHKTYNLDVLITRCSNNYGPNQFPEKLIPLFITNLIEGKPLPMYGDGRNVRNWIHVFDHCKAVHSVLTSGDAGNIYNVGSSTEISNLELTGIVLKLMEKDESCIEFVKDRLGHDLRYSIDFTKITNQLNFRQETPFEKGISDTVSWYLQNQAWWGPLKKP